MKKKEPTLRQFSIALIIVAILFVFLTIKCSNNEPEQIKDPIEIQFSEWDGSHIQLTNEIKRNMNNPDSYEHIETKYMIKDNIILVSTSFRGTNVFGAVVINNAFAEVDMNGKIINITYN